MEISSPDRNSWRRASDDVQHDIHGRVAVALDDDDAEHVCVVDSHVAAAERELALPSYGHETGTLPETARQVGGRRRLGVQRLVAVRQRPDVRVERTVEVCREGFAELTAEPDEVCKTLHTMHKNSAEVER